MQALGRVSRLLRARLTAAARAVPLRRRFATTTTAPSATRWSRSAVATGFASAVAATGLWCASADSKQQKPTKADPAASAPAAAAGKAHVASSSATVPTFKPSASSALAPPEEELQLRYLTVVFRHGARTPIGPMAGESLAEFQATWAPHCDATPDTSPTAAVDPATGKPVLVVGQPGQLTKIGRAQLVELGRWLRARYVTGDESVVTASPTNELPYDLLLTGPTADSRPRNAPPTVATRGFLPDVWSAESFYVRATGIPRTQHSAGGLLHGLYPVSCPTLADADALVAAHADVRKARGPYDPQAVMQTHNTLDETMSPMWGGCDRLRELYWLHRQAPTMAVFENGPRALAIRHDFARAFGVPETDFLVSWVPLFDSLSCREFHGIAPPPAALPALRANPMAMHEISAIAYGVFSGVLGGSDEIIRLAVGRFLGETLKRMDDAKAAAETAASASTTTATAKKGGGVRCSLVATHDTTIVPMSFTLPGVFDPSEWSPFASNIVIELLQHKQSQSQPSQSQWYVRVLYNGQPTNPAAPTGPATAPATSLMTLDELRHHWAKWIPADWTAECRCAHTRVVPAQKW